VVDTFMGSGSTLAAAEAMGLASVGVERNEAYFALATKAVPRLAKVSTASPGR
jgi:site-specific DNA-methyltransferase (adenine-specific)